MNGVSSMLIDEFFCALELSLISAIQSFTSSSRNLDISVQDPRSSYIPEAFEDVSMSFCGQTAIFGTEADFTHSGFSVKRAIHCTEADFTQSGFSG